MRHQFFRLFLSIILIAFAIIFVQCIVIFAGNWHLANSWKDLVFEEFISSLKTVIGNISDADSVMNVMVSRTTERISGLLIRDKDGQFVLSLGASPAGVQMPSPERLDDFAVAIPQGRLKLSYQDSITYDEREIPAAKYALSITTYPDLFTSSSVALSETDEKDDMVVSLPSIVADQDIAGTIRIELNGETLGYLDVLVYRMNYYAPTLFATKELLLAFALSIPFAIIVSMILAAIVSKSNARSVKEIQNGLESLSRGYYSVDIPKQKTDEMAQIASSIKALGVDLSRHQRSRKEWIRNISHDLNTPVTSLSILISGAIDGIFPVDEKFLSSLKKENDTLSERIASVGYYSFLLSPDARAEKEDVDVGAIAADVISSKGLSCVLPDNDIEAYADPALLSRALCEVIRNADAYGLSDDAPVMTLRIGGDGSSVIEVRNRGSLPKPLPQFFEPWARGDESRTSGGSGLGLPIVHQIMELHSGSVTIAESGAFVTVTLKFPQRP